MAPLNLAIPLEQELGKQIYNALRVEVTTLRGKDRTVHQQVILREAGIIEHTASLQVLPEDAETFKRDGRKGKIEF